MTTRDTGWTREKVGLGVWPHRGKVAIAGWGHSPVDRRWDGVSMDKTLGAYAILAAKGALEDAGVKPEEVDGLLVCPHSMAGGTAMGGGGSASVWAPRPYFDPPYDSEDGLSIVTGKWMLKNMKLPNVKYAPEEVPAIGAQMGMAAQAVADGLCNVALVVYTGANFEGRYRQGGDNASDYAKGPAQWESPWGLTGSFFYNTVVPIQQYCAKYGTTWEELLGPVVVNQHRNGLMNWWSYYTLNGPSGLTYEDYVNSRGITWPMRMWDCDRPVNAVCAFLFTTAERARAMRQKPVYVLNHNEGNAWKARSSQVTLEEEEEMSAIAARMAYEGSGLSPRDVDIFNPYDGYSSFIPIILEAFQWHGVKKGDAAEFLKGDIRIEGSHPFSSGGGNLGNGRTRSAMYIDSIEQLRGTAGKRQVKVKAETAICGFAPMGTLTYICLSNSPS